MKKEILILIADPDAFFSYGLSLGLFNHLSAQGWNVTITYQPEDKEDATLLFVARSLPISQLNLLKKSASDRKKPLIFIIDDCRKDTALWNKNAMGNIVFRHQNIEEIMTLVAEILEDNKALLHRARATRLTPREIEVMQYFHEGLGPGDIACALGIHMKTVSAHKCNAMNKLGFSKTSELWKWLLKGGLLVY